MSSVDTKEGGIYAWMASVRASMANDPCRQLFEDQVQTHAFIFLDDYLEHILAGPKQGPIIELVKTPGRKKNIPNKTRATTAASAKVKATFLSLDGDNSAKDVPINSFHEALLKAKERIVQDTLVKLNPPTDSPSASNNSVEKMHSRPDSARVFDAPRITVSVQPELEAGAAPLQRRSVDLPTESMTPFPSSEHGNELSVIAEGDESPERSHVNILPFSTIAPDLVQMCPSAEGGAKTFPVNSEPQGVPLTDDRYTILSPVDFIPPDSPHEVRFSEANIGNHTEPLPTRTGIDSPKNRERNAFTAPLPVVPVSNSILIPGTISIPLNDSSPRVLAHKSGAVGFPVLSAPSPLRKSVRVAQDALTSSVLPAFAPAPVPLGKRTSWLMKAREAKAMEGTSSFPGASAIVTSTAFPRVSTAVKRKSGEMLGEPRQVPELDNDQRKSKVPKPIEPGAVPSISKETEKTRQHGLPSAQGKPVAFSFAVPAASVDHLESHTVDIAEQTTNLDSTEEGFIDLFKRTVEGLGARAGKSMGKSLGGAAVAALAEARAAAEAKVAERNKVNSASGDFEVLHDDGSSEQELLGSRAHSDDQLPHYIHIPVAQAEGTERLSLSDLAPVSVQSNEPELSANTTQAMDVDARADSYDGSVSTTPPVSPPLKGSSGFVKPAGPVFNRPQPVFMPPASKRHPVISGRAEDFSSNFPPDQFTLSTAVPLCISARLTSPSDGLPSLVHGTSQMSVQPLQSGAASDTIFGNRDGVTTRDSSMRDTQYGIDSEPHDVQCATAVDDDDDYSWPLEEKLAASEQGWRPFDFSNVDKEDTWSSLPTESQGPTRSLTTEESGDVVALPNETDVEAETSDEEKQRKQEISDISKAKHYAIAASEPGEVDEAEVASLRRVEPAGSTSQTSTAPTAASSQPHTGFFSQATKLVNNMLGGGKKAKPELKSLQLAAAVAKKQQEESDKKLQRLKDMEARRQAAIAKRAEEEKTRHLGEEKKSKEEFEKRKRDREENTDRRPLKLPVSTKKEDDASKKRRLAPETEKKPESKKPPSKDRKDAVLAAKSVVTPVAKLATQKGAKLFTTALVSSTTYNATQNGPPAPTVKPFIPEAKPFKVVPSTLKAKATAQLQEDDICDRLPSTMVQSQMAARAKAQMQATKLPAAEVPSESIELPEINSEYSDSGDEDRVRTFDPPDWAQSPELRQALQTQSTVNPDDVFGAIRPLRMEEMFQTRHSRFRARTSSANWSGTDGLTVEEIREYERRMGYQQTQES